MWPGLQQVLLLRLQTQYLVDTPHSSSEPPDFPSPQKDFRVMCAGLEPRPLSQGGVAVFR